MSCRPSARLTAAAAVLVAGAGLAACGTSFGLPDPASEEGDAVARLWSPVVVAALAVGALVWGLVIWSVVRYRRRGDALPTQVDEHIPIEVFYTVVPVLIVAVLFGVGTFAYRDVNRTVADPDVVVTVQGFQWSWQFTYEGTDVVVSGDGAGTRGPELVLPEGRTTRLKLVSDDVNHSFWVPRFLSKRDLVPGVRNEVDVTPTETGTHVGRCAEFCGLDHWRMNLRVRVVPPGEFDRWLAEGADPAPAGGSSPPTTAGEGG